MNLCYIVRSFDLRHKYNAINFNNIIFRYKFTLSDYFLFRHSCGGGGSGRGSRGRRQGIWGLRYAYVGHKAVVAGNATDKSPGTDTKIEDTRVDAHRHGGIMGREHDNFILERDIIDSDGETPQYAQHGHQPDAQ